ncbi:MULTISPECIES: hypothetical protein [unclassified Candidatus Tisiphia]|uniref:hypothetical protein n=1 Tax=unclassified Candidatus Tisiphia TaxID=2996318 RepID=UPI00313D578F
MLGLLAIAFTFAYVVGQWQNSIRPIKLKKHGRKSISLFRYGLDYLQRIFLNIEEMMEVITKFIKPITPSLLRLSPC